MHFWKDNQGNKLTRKEFMTRWKQGIQSVTPLQQMKIQVRSTMIMLVGLLSGIIITIINIKTLWWVLVILVGVFGFTSMQFLGLLQKKKALEDIEFQISGLGSMGIPLEKYTRLMKTEKGGKEK